MLPRAAFRPTTVLQLQFRVRKCYDWSEERPIGEKSGDFAVAKGVKDVLFRRLRLDRDDPIIAEKPAILRPEIPVPDLTFRPPAVEQPEVPVSEEPIFRMPPRFRAIHKSPKPEPARHPPQPEPTQPTRPLQAHLDDPLLVTAPPCTPPPDGFYNYRHFNFLAATTMPDGLVFSRTGKNAVVLNPEKGGARPVGLLRDFPWTRLRRLKRIIYLEPEDGRVPKEWAEIRGDKAAKMLKKKVAAGEDTDEPEFLVVKNRDMLIWHRGPIDKKYSTIEATIERLQRIGAIRPPPPPEEQKPAQTLPQPKKIPSPTITKEKNPESQVKADTTRSARVSPITRPGEQIKEATTNPEQVSEQDSYIPSYINAVTRTSEPQPIKPHIPSQPNPITPRLTPEEKEEAARLRSKEAKKEKYQQDVLEVASRLNITALTGPQRRELRAKEYVRKHYGSGVNEDEGFGPIIRDRRLDKKKKEKRPRYDDRGDRPRFEERPRYAQKGFEERGGYQERPRYENKRNDEQRPRYENRRSDEERPKYEDRRNEERPSHEGGYGQYRERVRW